MLRIKTLAIVTLACILSACSNAEKKEEVNKNTSGRPARAAAKAIPDTIQNVLFFGTSLTAGYGLEDQAQAYPALIQKKIEALNLPYRVINAGLSGETSAAGKTRIDWLLKQPVGVFVLELGANDGLRGLSVKQTSMNLQAVIDRVKKKNPEVKLLMLGMQMPPNMGAKYTTEFKELFSNLASKNQMAYVPFLLEGVGGVPKLNQQDGIHPTAEGQKILAENVWKELEGLL
ncbi:arylesterase [Pedobacter sp. GR22-6]|uniref:arylesterase n=1 Tax=Pedobacter sp. GR22-6 TaxID=3127957 RepID=UPI00307EC406